MFARTGGSCARPARRYATAMPQPAWAAAFLRNGWLIVSRHPVRAHSIRVAALSPGRSRSCHHEHRRPASPVQATRKLVDEGAALHRRIDSDDPGCCLYELLKTTDHRLLGDSCADHRGDVYRIRVEWRRRQGCPSAVDRHPGGALDRVPGRVVYEAD